MTTAPANPDNVAIIPSVQATTRPVIKAPCSRRSTAFPWPAMATATSGLQPRAAMVRR